MNKKRYDHQGQNQIDDGIQDYEFRKSSRKNNSLSKERFQNIKVRLSDRQNELYKGIRNNTLSVVHGPAGTSKAQPLDTPILTPNGWIKMGEIQVGDKVISDDGNPTVVTGVYPQGEVDIWELTFSDGTKTECCSDHLWFTQTDNDRNNRKWFKNSDNIVTKSKSPNEGSVKTTTEIVETLYTKRNRINHSIPITKPVNFNSKEVYLDPYIMGCLLSDSCLKNNIELSTTDVEIIESLDSFLHESIYTPTRSEYEYSITKEIKPIEDKIKEFLLEIGIYGKLNNEKFIPNCYKFNSVENRIKILRGLMDNDGSPSKDGKYVSFTSSSLSLIKDVVEIVQSLGGLATYNKPNSINGEYIDNKISGEVSYTISINMNPDINPFQLERKRNLVKAKNKYKPTKYIVGARLVGKKHAQCIKVSSKSMLYLTNDYIVTHNTFTSCYTALALLADKKIEKIIITKPIQESGENLGFLPGDIKEKLDPYIKSYYTNFCKIIGKEDTDFLFACEQIVFEPLAYMRGSTFDNCIMLLDEAQNASLKQIMLWVTRLGTDSKAILMGDTSQYDVKKKDSGYTSFIEMVEGMESLQLFEFKNEDIVRNKFLIEITNRYDKYRSENEI